MAFSYAAALFMAATLAYAAVGPTHGSIQESLQRVRRQVACPAGQVFNKAGLLCTTTCTSLFTRTECKPSAGCFCKAGTYLNDQKQCVPKEKCPFCTDSKGNQVGTGTTEVRDGQLCTCVAPNVPEWKCEPTTPPPTTGCHCGGCGDPHYTTCDGKHFDFQGLCSYFMTSGSGYSVETENAPCGAPSSMVACIQSVTIKIGAITIKLNNNNQMFLNTVLYSTLPYNNPSPAIAVVQNGFNGFKVTLPNGIIVTYSPYCIDVYIPPTLNGTTNGLCGLYNNNQVDDYRLPTGGTAATALAFGNSWATVTGCATTFPPATGRKKRAVSNLPAAKAICDKLSYPPLSTCNAAVSPANYASDCNTDIKSAYNDTDAVAFACKTLESYAKACADKGMFLAWRELNPECAVTCKNTGTKFNSCGKPCDMYCKDLSLPAQYCTAQCVEGCFCPAGNYLDKNGRCVLQDTCPCYIGEKEFASGLTATPPGQKLPCTCKAGRWMCDAGVIIG